MEPLDFIKTARELTQARGGKPRQTNLRRASSTAYYAVFHYLARCGADLLVGGPGASKSVPAWDQVYRSLEHGYSKDRCKDGTIITKFPQEIQDFANTFVSLQTKRHLADYAPNERFYKSAVITDIDSAEYVIKQMQNVSKKDKRAFAALVLLRKRRG